MLSYIRAGRLFDESSNSLDACQVLIDRLLEVYFHPLFDYLQLFILLQAEEQLPHLRYAAMVWQAVGVNVAERERPLVKQLLWAYLIFQVGIQITYKNKTTKK